MYIEAVLTYTHTLPNQQRNYKNSKERWWRARVSFLCFGQSQTQAQKIYSPNERQCNLLHVTGAKSSILAVFVGVLFPVSTTFISKA